MQLAGVVRIVVVDICTVVAALEFQPAACAGEFSQRSGRIFAGDARLPCHSRCGQRVHGVVLPEHVQLQAAVVLPGAIHVKFAEIGREIFAADVVCLAEAE